MQAAKLTCKPLQACRALPARRPFRCRRLVVAAAEKPPQNNGPEQPKENSEARQRQMDELKSSLKRMGIDKETAQRILAIWRKSGAASPEGLRKLFLKRSFSRSQQIGLQFLVDAVSGAGAFYAAKTITSEQLGSWALSAKAIFYFISSYLWIGASFELFSLAALAYATVRYSTNADAFLITVQDIAGGSSGLSVVDQAKKAVNIVKVLQALDQIRDLLKGGSAESETFFDNLGVYLTLERAQRLYGFEAARYGLDDAQAAEIAAVFGRYDANDDGFISLSEFRDLCRESVGAQLSGEEVQAAFELLDVDKSGALDFGEWVDWFLQKQRQGGSIDGMQAPAAANKAASGDS